jgi:hypothetical protein
MKIKVTQAHIDSARIGNRCPVAQALSEAFGQPVYVGRKRCFREMWVGKRMGLLEPGCELPTEVVIFVEAFDNGQRIEPFEFEIEVF